MRIAFTSLLVLLSAPALAQNWTMQPDSLLGFTASQDGSPFEGQFEQFSAEINFDPTQLDSARFDVTIDLESVSTGSRQRDLALRDPEWFHLGEFTKATYVAEAFEADPEGGFIAQGVLDLKGTQHPIPLHFTWQVDDAGIAHLEGRAEIHRLDFAVGEGDWSTEEVVGYAVGVKVDLELSQAQ